MGFSARSQVLTSPTPGMATLSFNVLPSGSSTTLASIIAALTATNPSLSLSVGGSTVALSTPSDPAPPRAVSPSYVSVTIQNSALAASLPLNQAEAAALDSSMRTFVHNQTQLGSDLLSTVALVRVHMFSCVQLS